MKKDKVFSFSTLSLIILLFLFNLFISPAHAITRVYVQNNTTLSFTVKSSQDSFPLAGSKWGQKVTRISPGQRVEVVWFNLLFYKKDYIGK